MTNYILIHKYANEVIARYDFGNDLEALYKFFDDTLLSNLYQIGRHDFTVFEEFTHEIIDTMTSYSNAA